MLRFVACLLLLSGIASLSGCARVDHIGRAPEFSPPIASPERVAMIAGGVPDAIGPQRRTEAASLWSAGQRSLLGDRRAMKRGDILTVVIDIDEEAEINNRSERSRTGSEALGIADLFGIPERINENITDGASLDTAVGITSDSRSRGDGSVRRSEELTLRIAATITDVLPNGVLALQGAQEVRVNYELRELLVSGYVRPEDISRRNEITYDKIANARISYGGRGQISDVQQPRIGQQVLDAILPF
ncbi:flagellar basal body L-ring protein FlgH [Citreimonas salinaria]|uniref:Flagellar L-ring protein n=1 Tax=Citreimonas salinaria TaxID=321339 RepID=A0A1H3LT64_9RHOB|nr:flagellar basal body L-ring protein FlgH [Citreimonas salinaria]SDY67204.1 flagellar L-ring protein precursor FlgH [Citreimonas salinaria]